MKQAILSTLAVASTLGAASADLYYIPGETQEPIPLRWTAGVDVIYDTNVTPTAGPGPGHKDEAVSANPFVGLTFVSISPQSTLDVSLRLGAIYYFDTPDAIGSDDLYGQAHLSLNWTHRVNERLRFSSRNYVSYELEPDYSVGVATTRQLGEYLYATTDNSVGYRWTERLATYTGFTLTWLDYDGDVSSQDRFTWSIYNQFRFQVNQQLVATAEYRFANTDSNGLASDYKDHYILIGVEYRFSPNTIVTAKAGAQIHDADSGDDNTSPYFEVAARTQVNQQLSIRGFLRYSVEGYDTVRGVATGDVYDFDKRSTLRIGISSEYAISNKLSLFGGIDYIPATFDDGRLVAGTGSLNSGKFDEDLVNAYIGLNVKFTDLLSGSVSYNYTNSDSDFPSQSYDRSRVSVGVRAEF
ncbi:MAG: hypothetical protein JWO82_1618 [Akkermansiaceae bacterium]|nr:hypothetical protein [Akkermansiaceae bacterium]